MYLFILNDMEHEGSKASHELRRCLSTGHIKDLLMEQNGFSPLLGQTMIQRGMQKHYIPKKFEIDVKTKRRHHSEHQSKHYRNQKTTENSMDSDRQCDNHPSLTSHMMQERQQYLSASTHQSGNVRKMSLRKRLSQHGTQRAHVTESPVLGKRRTSSVPDESSMLLSSAHVVNQDPGFLSPNNRWLLPSQSSYRRGMILYSLGYYSEQ